MYAPKPPKWHVATPPKCKGRVVGDVFHIKGQPYLALKDAWSRYTAIEPLPGMDKSQLHRAISIAQARYYPVEALLLDQQFSCLAGAEGCEAIDLAGLEDHERQGIIERAIRSIKTLVAKEGENLLADSGSYADRALWATKICQILNRRPLLQTPYGIITPDGLQAGIYPPEVLAVYNAQRAHAASRLAAKDAKHPRPSFKEGDT
eukprot:11704278-Prorocentrum_lima.AAC.1